MLQLALAWRRPRSCWHDPHQNGRQWQGLGRDPEMGGHACNVSHETRTYKSEVNSLFLIWSACSSKYWSKSYLSDECLVSTFLPVNVHVGRPWRGLVRKPISTLPKVSSATGWGEWHVICFHFSLQLRFWPQICSTWFSLYALILSSQEYI